MVELHDLPERARGEMQLYRINVIVADGDMRSLFVRCNSWKLLS